MFNYHSIAGGWVYFDVFREGLVSLFHVLFSSKRTTQCHYIFHGFVVVDCLQYRYVWVTSASSYFLVLDTGMCSMLPYGSAKAKHKSSKHKFKKSLSDGVNQEGRHSSGRFPGSR